MDGEGQPQPEKHDAAEGGGGRQDGPADGLTSQRQRAPASACGADVSIVKSYLLQNKGIEKKVISEQFHFEGILANFCPLKIHFSLFRQRGAL